MEDLLPLDSSAPPVYEARPRSAVSLMGLDSPIAESVPSRLHTVRGGGGTALSVYDVGDPHGPALFFIHGFSQCHLAWWRQFHSALALGFRLVALDLRGHGHSDKPRRGYDDGRLWAQDVQAVITALELKRPLLVAWSYGGLVVADYLRHCGQEQIAGVNFVSALVKLGTEEALGLLAPELHALLPGLFCAREGAASRAALKGFVSLLHHQPVTSEVRRMVLAYSELVPAYVREGLGARVVDNDRVLEQLEVPVLVSHGLEDRVVRPDSSRHLAARVPGARVSLYAGAGHSPFWEDARRFNRELAAFAARCW